jgi:hypothetical protein
VTGGARGCGLAFARGLAEAGANVAIFDIIEPDAAFYNIAKDYNVRTAHYKSVLRFSLLSNTLIDFLKGLMYRHQNLSKKDSPTSKAISITPWIFASHAPGLIAIFLS